MMFKPKSQRQALLLGAIATAFVCACVHLSTLLIYPRELWDFEIPNRLGITIILAWPTLSLLSMIIWRNNIMQEELLRLVNFDRLTQVATRESFFKRVAETPDLSGICLMVDIDHFKSVNDDYGHLVGDRVIRQVAETLRSQVRESDIVCRFGGEEFVVFLKDAHLCQAETIAERMRTEVENGKVIFGNTQVCVTISVGGADKNVHEEITASIQKADEALYRAKNTGRNRVMWNISREGAPISGLNVVSG